MRLVRFALFFLLCISTYATSPARAQESEAERLHMECLLTQDIRQRIEACTVAINRPDLKATLRDDAYVVRAGMYVKQGRLAAARADFEAARQLDPTNAPLIDQALAKLAELEAQAKSPDVQDNLAFMLCQNGSDPSERVRACDKVILASAGDPSKQAASYALRAAAFADQGNYDATLSDLDAAIRLDGAQVFYPNLKARALYYSGRYAESLSAYRGMADGAFASENAPLIAALEYLLGNLEESADAFRNAHDVGRPGNVFSFYAALIQSEIGKGDAAEFEKLTFDPQSEGQFGVALLNYRRGDLDAAALRTAADSLPFGKQQARCMAEFNIGHRLALMKDRAGAVSPFRTASEICDRKSFEYHASKLWLQRTG